MEFEQIWQRFYAPLVVFCAHFNGVRNSGMLQPEDLAQEVLLKVFTRIEAYDRNYSMATWVYRIARNHCIDAVRKAAAAEGRALSGNEPGRETGPELEAERKELEMLIDGYLAGLENTDRHIAFLRFSENLKLREIARILEMPAGTVKYRLHRIRNGLRVELKEAGYA